MTYDYQLRVLPQVAADSAALRSYICEEKGIAPKSLNVVRILKRSIDARQRTIFVNLTVRAYVDELPEDDEFEHIVYPDVSDKPQVIIVGAGPAGLFAALRLIELGFRPIVLERGKDVHERKKDLARISVTQQVDGESNYCFGEGGAGAYSDGKLYTRSKKRGNTEKILRVFCQHGASTNILADAHPHIGTDRLPQVIEAMRNTIIKSGGEVHFQTKMTELVIDHSPLTIDHCQTGRVIGVKAQQMVNGQCSMVNGQCSMVNGQCSMFNEKEFLGPVILATGHSARDVYRYLASEVAGGGLEPKGIAVGVRLEHPAQLIDQIQYHRCEGRGKWLPAAEYSFVTQVDGRGVYSFCMCPGGFVIPAATGPEQVVVNGMSPASRGTQWSNSGMVVEIRPEDLDSSEFRVHSSEFRVHSSEFKVQSSKSSNAQQNYELCIMNYALKMMAFQEDLERLCWLQAGMKQTAPAQRMADFVNGRLSTDLPRSSYAPGLVVSPLHFWMPKPIASRLQQAFRHFGKQAHGFLTNEAVLIGVETRTSSPVRIVRNPDTLQHIALSGLYPCGEGAGYAGGIVSAAVDGERCAEMVASTLR
ncbi:MAG: NAD(P)/FAD-dependent oxidoreductase [Prevotella sp.]|nr:NAD(P)/FAD-dependent oxidoreductase [Prevotella sp.]